MLISLSVNHFVSSAFPLLLMVTSVHSPEAAYLSRLPLLVSLNKAKLNKVVPADLSCLRLMRLFNQLITFK